MKRWLIIGLLGAGLRASSQDFPRREINLEKLTDEFFAVQDQDLNYQELYENLLQLLANPLDLNNATEEQLRALLVLDELLLQKILDYRQQLGPFLSVYELQSIPGFTRDLFLKIIPFVTVRDATQTVDRNLWQRIRSEDNHYLILRTEQVMETRVGFLSSDTLKRFPGLRQDFYIRYRLARPGDFSFGFTADHDAGEPFRWQNGRQYGFDFWSVHGQLMNKGRVKNLIIGDFQAQFGQGLALGGAFGLGKNAESVTTVRRSNLGFLPYTSVSEAGFFRGVALSYAVLPKVTVHAFGSSAPRDAQIENDNDRESGNFSSIYFTGLHRSAQEQDNRHTLREQNAGLVVEARSNSL
ncbi:MAG: ComEA family DNA-binding protein, partial [Cyclobacteriaceae bacterium]